MSGETRVGADSRTLFQIFDPRQVEEEVVRAEPKILEDLAEPEFIRTGVESVDYLVDQWRFAKAGLADAERRGLRGLAALEWTSYLSWPECRRQAGPRWRQDLLRRYAFEESSPWWQAALHAHSADDAARLVGPPRKHVWLPSKLLFGPYPSKHGPTALAPACLETDIISDTETRPGPLTPIRRLSPDLTWMLRVAVMRLYAGRAAFSEIIVDEPRTYSASEARDVLLALAQQWEMTLEAAMTASTPLAPDAAAQWRKGIDQLRAEAERITQAGTRDRATRLELLFSIPGTIWLIPVDVLTDDLPPEWFGVMLGFALERRGVLSVRERKQLRRAATAMFDTWQTTRYPRHEIVPERTALIVDRLPNLRRLLQPASLFAYLAQLTRRHRRGRNQGD